MIEWLVRKGIFRNANHAIWFLTSIGFLFVTLTWHFFPNQPLIFIIISAVVHLPPFITSVVTVYVQKRDSDIYSKDCIWFNAIMMLVYIFLFIIN